MTIKFSDIELVRNTLAEQIKELDQLILSMEFTTERNRLSAIRNTISDQYHSLNILLINEFHQ